MVVSSAKKSSKLKMFSIVMLKLTIKIGSSKRIIIAIFVIIRKILNILLKLTNQRSSVTPKIFNFQKALYPSLLEKHMDVHTGAKPLKCRFCDYSTREKTTLQNHESREHTGERPYQCDVTGCDYTGNVLNSVYLKAAISNGAEGLFFR